jgi:deoxycytidylate deaminase
MFTRVCISYKCKSFCVCLTHRFDQNHIYIRCTYGIFGREITKYTVIYGVDIRFWPTLLIRDVTAHGPCVHVLVCVLPVSSVCVCATKGTKSYNDRPHCTTGWNDDAVLKAQESNHNGTCLRWTFLHLQVSSWTVISSYFSGCYFRHKLSPTFGNDSPSSSHIHIHTHARTHACTHARMHARMHTRTHARTHAHTQTGTITHTHFSCPGCSSQGAISKAHEQHLAVSCECAVALGQVKRQQEP